MKPYEYFLVQYAPSTCQDLRVPIGVFLLETSGRLVRYGLTANWRALRCLDPAVDRAFLETLPAYFAQIVREGSQETPDTALRERLLWMAENVSGSLQLSLPRGVETSDPEQEFDRLYAEYVERRRAASSAAQPRPGSRRWIQGRLQESLQRHDLLDRGSRNVSVDEFTAPGDGFRIDFAYRPNGMTHYLHALALDHDWNQAKVLSYTFGRIRQRLPARLTAIVGESDPARPAAQSCRQILLDSGIALQPLPGLDGFLDTVRQEWPAP
jgi:hypothetical protein